MENSEEIIKLVNDFVEAVENSDQETVNFIAEDILEFREKYFGRKYKNSFKRTNLEIFKKTIHKLYIETEPYIYISKRKAKIVYEIRSGWHFSETNFQSGFIRHSFCFTRQKKWKLKAIKKEFLRFSKYNVKESFNGLAVWFAVQTFGIRNGFNKR
jgi:hypothetical protein